MTASPGNKTHGRFSRKHGLPHGRTAADTGYFRWTVVLALLVPFVFGLGMPGALFAQNTTNTPDTIEIHESSVIVESLRRLRLRPVQGLSNIDACTIYVFPGAHEADECSLVGDSIQPDIILYFDSLLPLQEGEFLFIQRLESGSGSNGDDDAVKYRITNAVLQIPGPQGTVKKGRSSNEIEITFTRDVPLLEASNTVVTASNDTIGVRSVVEQKGVSGNETVVVRLDRSLKNGATVTASIESGDHTAIAKGKFKNKAPAKKEDAMLYGEFSLLGSTGEWDPVYTVDAAMKVALKRDIIARWNVLFEASLFWNSDLDENARKVSMGVPIQRYMFLSDNGRNGLDLSLKPFLEADRNFENGNAGVDATGTLELDSLIGNRYQIKLGVGTELGQNLGIDGSTFVAETGGLDERYLFVRPKILLNLVVQTANDDVYPRIIFSVPATLRFLMRDEAFLTDEKIEEKNVIQYRKGPYPFFEPAATVPLTEHFGITGKLTYGYRPGFFAEENRFSLAFVAKW